MKTLKQTGIFIVLLMLAACFAIPVKESCSLQTYTSKYVKGLSGSPIRVDPGFVKSMNSISNAAQHCGVTVYVTQSFRKSGQPVSGAIVPPAKKSNHLVGHAIDFNLQTSKGWCNSKCLRDLRSNLEANCFIKQVKAAGLRWGGDFRRTDPVHIDDWFNRSLRSWDSLFCKLQRNCNNIRVDKNSCNKAHSNSFQAFWIAVVTLHSSVRTF